MNVIWIKLLLTMLMDLPWLIHGIFSFHVKVEVHMETCPPLAHITLNYPIPNLYTLKQNIDAILRNTTHDFEEQGYTSYNNINEDTIQFLIHSNLVQHLFLVRPSMENIVSSKS